jgi:signal transduction histidine kinase/CheY-like chemotaxis protein
MTSKLDDVGLLDLLNLDPRPTFVVALPSVGSSSSSSTTSKPPQPRTIQYMNPSLTANATLLEAITAIPQDANHKPFWDWVTSPAAASTDGPARATSAHSLAYYGITWTRTHIRGRWIVMSGIEMPESSEPPRKVRRLDAVGDGASRVHRSEPATAATQIVDFALRERATAGARALSPLFLGELDSSPDAPTLNPDTEPFLDVIQGIDWDKHPLGPMDSWPVRLQQAYHQILPDSRAIAIYWGPDYLAFYNEAFSKLCGSNHPELLGQPILKTWSNMKERLDQVWHSEVGSRHLVEDEARFFVDMPSGSLEETHVKYALTPIIENRQTVGMQHSMLDDTSLRLWARRMKFLVDLGETLITARDVQSYWTKTLEQFEQWSPAYDVPLAFLYSVDEDDENDSSHSRYDCPKICKLAGSLGVPDDHPIAPKLLELRDTDNGLAPSFREALRAQIALRIQTDDGTLPKHLLEGLNWRGFGDACQSAVICPIRPTKDENVMGLLFLGLNPRRPYDNDYKQFIALLHQKLTSSLASTVLLEEEARRGRNAAAQAAYDTAMLQSKLAWQTEQANQSIQNFQAVAEFIPVGMSINDSKGNITFANDAWYRITGHPKGPTSPDALYQHVVPEDRSKIQAAYAKLSDVDVVTCEFRIPREEESKATVGSRRSASVAGLDTCTYRHVLALTKAERAADGTVARTLSCLTDVTQQKDTAEEAVRRAQEAQNLKRLAEFATVGMYDISLDGRLVSANNSFWELSGLAKVDLTKADLEPWETCVIKEDLPLLKETLTALRVTGRPQTAEIRLKTTWTAQDASGKDIAAARSVMATFIPVKSSEGVIQSFTGCISDVSQQNWRLEQEMQRKEEALESKRQQQNFIDMTSHEMRNPLSAIVHSTDSILANLARVIKLGTPSETNKTFVLPPPDDPKEKLGDRLSSRSRADEIPDWNNPRKLLVETMDNAETILTCAQHQKRIVDDILTMSKLDSKLLAITPCTTDPIVIMQDALKMFDVEARKVDINLSWVVDPSFKELGYEFLDFDPSRVRQVLINLLTNAIKFTKTETERTVTIRLKGSHVRPDETTSGVNFVPRFQSEADDYEQPDLEGRDNGVYLTFEVKDTGQGLTEEEMKGLFNKFVQASTRTHVRYGGSGLGLFISRRLTELQNGAIGVASEFGVGSTFVFFIEAYIPAEEARIEAEKEAAQLKEVINIDADDDNIVPILSETSVNGLKGFLGPLVKRQLGRRPPAVNVDGILVVEDNLINQQITRRQLLARGYTVDVANHGIEALQKLRKAVTLDPIDLEALAQVDGQGSGPRGQLLAEAVPLSLVLMDVEMPVQDGLTCTRIVRELESSGEILSSSGGRVPIIAVTANARQEQITEAKQAGCDDVLVKPYRMPELEARMQLVLRKIGGLSPECPPQPAEGEGSGKQDSDKSDGEATAKKDVEQDAKQDAKRNTELSSEHAEPSSEKQTEPSSEQQTKTLPEQPAKSVEAAD